MQSVEMQECFKHIMDYISDTQWDFKKRGK